MLYYNHQINRSEKEIIQKHYHRSNIKTFNKNNKQIAQNNNKIKGLRTRWKN